MRKENPLTGEGFYLPDPQDFSTRAHPIEIVVGHCTGGGIVQQGLNALCGNRPPSVARIHGILDNSGESMRVCRHAVDFYRKVNKVSTTFVIGWHGEIFQTLPEDCRAWSAGIRGDILELYKRGYAYWSKWALSSDGKLQANGDPSRYRFWEEEYKEIMGVFDPKASPLDLCGGTRGPDHVGISVDLLSPPYMQKDERGLRRLGPNHPLYEAGYCYTLPQHARLRELLETFRHYPLFKRDRQHVLPHSFTSPLERSYYAQDNQGRWLGWGWDPGKINWGIVLG